MDDEVEMKIKTGQASTSGFHNLNYPYKSSSPLHAFILIVGLIFNNNEHVLDPRRT